MALEKEIVTDQGFTCPNGYIVIVESKYVKGCNSQATAHIFKDKLSSTQRKQHVGTINITFICDLNSTDNITAQAYKALKLLPEYVGALDV